MANKNTGVDLQKYYNSIRSKVCTPWNKAQPLTKFVDTNYSTNVQEVKIFSKKVYQDALIANSKNSVEAENFISIGNNKLKEINQVTNNQGKTFCSCYKLQV